VSISPDGAHLRTVSAYATVKIWELRTGKELLSVQDAYPARPPSILCASFSPDGSHVALPYTHGPLRICRVKDGECIASFVHRGTWVTKLAFTPDGRTICYGMEDGTVCIRPLAI
ncbi:quinon protein alcohol dehydrogenase-like superfamily, partial [Earliella scabrosa]